jgi:hypothetical protein
MSLLPVAGAFLAISGSAIFGYVTSAVVSSTKFRELQFAYNKLANFLRELLREIPTAESGLLVLAHEDVVRMRQVLCEADELAGYALLDEPRR